MTWGGFRAVVVWIGFALALFLAPRVFTSGGAHTALCLMAVAIVFALSYNMLLGQTGLLSFGHAVYYGLAGFAVIHVMNVVIAGKWPVPLVVMPLVGGVAGLVSAVFLGWVSTRRGGLVFSMITLGIGELVNSAALILHTFFGGEDGIETDRTGLAPFLGYKFGPQIQIYYLIAFWCFVSVVLMYAITRTPLERICNAVRDNPERAEFVGYDAKRVRYYAMCLSGFFAGVAGALSTMNFELTNASCKATGTSTDDIVGAVLVTLLQFMLSDATQAWMLYFGLLFIFVVMFAPGGVAGWLHRHFSVARTGRLWLLAPSYALAAPALALSFVGGVLLIELTHHLLLQHQVDGPDMSIFQVQFSDVSRVAWAAAVIALGLGLAGLRLVWPKVSEAWARALGGSQDLAPT